MSQYISVWASPDENARKPYCTIGSGGHAVVHVDTVTISLGDIPDQAAYLRDWAHKLLALAADVDARSDTREPSGYDAPVPYAPTGLDERAAAEMLQ